MKEKNYFQMKLLALLFITLTVAACAPGEKSIISSISPSNNVITIGFMAPLSGDAASYGLSILKGAQLAVKEAKLENIKLIVEDSKCDPQEAVSATNKLISVDNVQAIVGEICSGATLAAAPIAEQNHIVMISPSSTSPKITQAGEYIFRTVPSDALQGAFGAQLVAEKGHKKLAVLYGNEEYSVGFNDVLVKEFPKHNGEVVASESFERSAVDLRTQITKIKNSGAEAIYIISNSPPSAVAALKQMKELGVKAALFGSEGLKSNDILTAAGKAAEGLTLTTVSGGNVGFLTKHKTEYGSEPGPFAAQGYDAFKAIALAIQQGARSGEEIKNALGKINFNGASGKIEFDENGDVSGNYDVFVVRDGQFVPE